MDGVDEWGGSENGLLIFSQDCPNCGRWWAPLDSVGPDLAQPDNRRILPFLAAHIRQTASATNERVVPIGEDWKERAAEHSRTPIPRKLDALLRWFEQQTQFAGDSIDLPATLAPMIDAANKKEVDFLIGTLGEQGLLVQNEQITGRHYRITARGWNYLRPVDSGGIAGTAFAAMWFDPQMDAPYLQGIVPAIESCGFTVNRVDRTPHNDQITDRIMAGIRSAQFVVADFTGQRPSVYYEAGFAQGLGKTVVRTCRDTDFGDLHFDTRQYLHIKWSTVEHLRSALEDHVRATIGSWIPRRD
ncbi:MAG: hypothetical protein Q8T13_19060 [Acidobacteriota bacterium]|nr:hypothetical protein [Acidobacteriota bacterium]